ncbi:hypothetical protein HanRHA438_Chr02g0060471 [Helianthus annuus]|nr:hypothetical protein HanRHA438_Chr02g0060471 [Helianthus annuus]
MLLNRHSHIVRFYFGAGINILCFHALNQRFYLGERINIVLVSFYFYVFLHEV